MSTTTTVPKVSAFRWVPPFAQGLVRDLRVRWALEEAGQPYEQRLLTRDDQKSEEYRRLQPFGQVPSLEADGVAIFESGAIVLHIAQSSEALMPLDPADRARTQTWMFAALNTVEPMISMLNFMVMMPGGAPEGAKPVRDAVLAAIGTRLDVLAKELGTRDYLVADRFTAADLLMVSVLRALRNTDLVKSRPALAAYQARIEERPAFQKALAAQMRVFEENAPQT